MMKRNSDTDRSRPQRWQMVLGALLLLALIVLAVFLVIEAIPHHVSNAKNPSFVDNIFANAVVLLAVRIALLAGAVYVVVSVSALIGSRRWLAELGPFKASEPIARVDKTADTLQVELGNALNTIKDLEARLQESDGSLAKAQADIELLLDHIDTLEAKKGNG